MTRVRYLAGLVGPTERRPAPLLRPPRRLFPHEPLPVEPPPPSQPVAEAAGDQPTPERPTVHPEPAPITHERTEREPAAVVPERARSQDAPAAPRADDVALPEHPVEDPPPAPGRETVRITKARTPVEAKASSTRPTDPPRPARHLERAPEPTPANRDPEPARVAIARRSATTLELSRLRPPVVSPPERAAAAASRPEPAPARAAGLHIGSIDVTVTPPPVAPGEPMFAAPPTPFHRAPAPFDPRGASMSRWFGLAQR